MAENINQEMAQVGYQNLGTDLRRNLAVLRRSDMPAVLVEAGFINSDRDNEPTTSRLLPTKPVQAGKKMVRFHQRRSSGSSKKRKEIGSKTRTPTGQ
jgi:hypothetical protein